ncbi:hypothetical protein [Pedobacter sp. UBA5917]|uniref:hypothetical protein n=1 Tax=Pedobacter sp. UBA5917 TaxID=1947061 RepID=UPI0025D73055|nr:hypothetical protein [Pedobacter sp. UBA5917]
MQDIYSIVEKTGLIDDNLKKIIKRQVLIPYLDHFNTPSDYWYPHPPCFIPFFLGHGPSYKGLVHHFFCERSDTFAEYSLEGGFISEIAKNPAQWLTLIVLEMIMLKDGITDEIVRFCNSANYTDYGAVDAFSIDYGDDPKEFKNLIYFRENIPARYVQNPDLYLGDFPSTLSGINAGSLENASIFEIAVPEQLTYIGSIPLWLDHSADKPSLFENYINKNMLREAWFTLNSKGWKPADTAAGLQKIAERTEDELFHLVSKNWIGSWKRSGNCIAP